MSPTLVTIEEASFRWILLLDSVLQIVVFGGHVVDALREFAISAIDRGTGSQNEGVGLLGQLDSVEDHIARDVEKQHLEKKSLLKIGC